MTDPPKRTTAEVWRGIEKLGTEAELERIDTLSDEELDRELRAAGIDPTDAAKVGQERLAKPPSATQPRRKVRWAAWIALAAVVALVLGALAKTREIIARRGPGEIRPEPVTPEDRAAKLRDDALGACGVGLWSACEEKLNAARALDPAGETDARVLAARQSIYDAQHVDAGHKPEKPPM